MKKTFSVGERVYWFNENHRIYSSDPSVHGPIYREHFRPLVIVKENPKEWVCDDGCTINKRSGKLDLGGVKRNVFTGQEVEDDVWVREWRYKIRQKVDGLCDRKKLERIKAIIEE